MKNVQRITKIIIIIMAMAVVSMAVKCSFVVDDVVFSADQTGDGYKIRPGVKIGGTINIFPEKPKGK